MEVKNNYNDCLTNLACSIRKYFNLEYKHNTLSYIDEILEREQPKNVVTILCDGMGANILDRTLNPGDFLLENKLKNIYTVFPATTVAATTSIMTGLNPVETAMLGWDMYFKDIDKVITTYHGSDKSDLSRKPIPEAIQYRNTHMITKTIMDEINEKGEYKGYTVSPFSKTPYHSVHEMYETIKAKCHEDGKKYIYAYNPEPDSSMHQYGCDSEVAKALIREANYQIEKLANEVDDTIIFVIADHGHINVNHIFLDDYPDIVDCLKRNTSLEPRATNFFIKDEKKEEFVKLFNEYFSEYFDLYPIDEVIKSKLFGDGEENPVYRDILGDYLAIAKSNKSFIYGGSVPLLSQHAGYTDDEIYVPLVLIKRK
jgi:arylsulfatase A-like enzyme